MCICVCEYLYLGVCFCYIWTKIIVSSAVISTALYATIKAGGAIRSQRVKLRPNLIEDVSFISTLLKYEFIFSAGGLEKNIDATLDDMVKADIMKIEEEALEPGQGAIIGNEGRWVGLSKEERRIGREHFGKNLGGVGGQ